MSKTLIWSDEALQDIEDIAEYISRDSLYYASQVVEDIVTTVELVSTQPLMGREVPELAQPNIREHFIYSYRLIYEDLPSAIHILAVIHGRRLLQSIDDRFES